MEGSPEIPLGEAVQVLDSVSPKTPAAAVHELREYARVRRTFSQDAATEFLASVQRRAKGEDLRRVSLPWRALSAALAGEATSTEGEHRYGLTIGLHTLIGTTGTGKTQFAASIAGHAVTHGIPTLYVSLELSRHDVVARIVSAIAGTKWSELVLGQREATHSERVAIESIAESRLLDIVEQDRSRFTTTELHAHVEAIRRARPDGPLLVVVDFLQLLGGDPHADVRMRFADAAYECHNVAKRFDATVLALSSTARANNAAMTEGEDRSASWYVSFAKEAGEIEYASTSVLVLRSCEVGCVDVGIAKLRHGACGAWFPLGFDGSRFVERERTVSSSAKSNGKRTERAEVQNEYARFEGF